MKKCAEIKASVNCMQDAFWKCKQKLKVPKIWKSVLSWIWFTGHGCLIKFKSNHQSQCIRRFALKSICKYLCISRERCVFLPHHSVHDLIHYARFIHFCFRLKHFMVIFFLKDEMRYFGLWFVCLVNDSKYFTAVVIKSLE